MWLSFFIQEEDGIRDGHVTGVQTCALPITFTVGSSQISPLVDHGMLVEAVGLSSSQMENSSALADVAPRTSTEDARPRVPAPANSFLRITNARSSELFQHTDGTSKVLKIFKQQESAMLQPYCVGIISRGLPVAFPLNAAPPDHLGPVRHRLRNSGHRCGPSSLPLS